MLPDPVAESCIFRFFIALILDADDCSLNAIFHKLHLQAFKLVSRFILDRFTDHQRMDVLFGDVLLLVSQLL